MQELLRALSSRGLSARQAWTQWRTDLVVDQLPYPCLQLLPALNPRLFDWLVDDPSAGVFRGIVRMAWSNNQMRLTKAAELRRILEDSGVGPVAVAGPLAWSIRALPAIRCIPHLTFLVPRSQVASAFEALVRSDGQPAGPPPHPRVMDWSDHIRFNFENLQVRLCWRAIPTLPGRAVALENACRSELLPLQWGVETVLTTSAEVTLLQILCDDREGDHFPWQADVALMDTSQIHWDRFRRLALRFCPTALERIEELRAEGLSPGPDLRPLDPDSYRRKFWLAWNQYRTQSYWRRLDLSSRGFALFLAKRWIVHWLGPPSPGARRVLQHFRSLLR